VSYEGSIDLTAFTLLRQDRKGMSAERQDPVTGVFVQAPDLTGKPLPNTTRVDITERAACPLCRMSETNDGFQMFDGEVSRPVLDRLGRFSAVTNRWPVLPGPAELVIGDEHVTSLEAMSLENATDMLMLLDTRYRALAQEFKSVAAFMNVGAGSGGSLSHAHAQIVASSSPPGPLLVRCRDRVGVQSDIETARAEGLVIAGDDRGIAWVPYAPSASVELRVSGLSVTGGASLTAEMVRTVGSIVCWPYNLVWHGGDQPFVQWLARIDLGRIYPDIFDRIIVQDPFVFASELKKALTTNAL
jgi:diadenosine tetraphosphate (Ap4A) HIT family hydrolase